MIPATTKHSGIRHYLPKKIHKWGFKNFVRAGESGITYNFFIYSSANTLGWAQCSCEDHEVLRLIVYLPAHQNFRLFLDNWFSTSWDILMQKLNKEGILATAAFWSNWIGQCPLTAEEELKQKEIGSFDYRTDQNSGFHFPTWCDNKCVLIGSNYAGAESSTTLERFDIKEKKKVKVSCPNMIKEYNRSMGGVDLADMLISLYHTKINVRKKWYLKIIFHCVDIAKTNGWLLYRRNCDLLQTPKKDIKPFRNFIAEIAEALISKGKDITRPAGRPPKRSLSPSPSVGRKPNQPTPILNVQFHGYAYRPEWGKSRGRCKRCSMPCSSYCMKCNVKLCFNKDSNCFQLYHT